MDKIHRKNRNAISFVRSNFQTFIFTAMQRHSTVDSYIDGHIEWRDGLTALRNILLETELEETVKWGAPCYVYQKKLVVGIGAFKSYLGLWFHQGALLKDKHKKLINAQEGKTKALRQWRFYDISEIDLSLIHI